MTDAAIVLTLAGSLGAALLFGYIASASACRQSSAT